MDKMFKKLEGFDHISGADKDRIRCLLERLHYLGEKIAEKGDAHYLQHEYSALAWAILFIKNSHALTIKSSKQLNQTQKREIAGVVESAIHRLKMPQLPETELEFKLYLRCGKQGWEIVWSKGACLREIENRET